MDKQLTAIDPLDELEQALERFRWEREKLERDMREVEVQLRDLCEARTGHEYEEGDDRCIICRAPLENPLELYDTYEEVYGDPD